MERLGSREPRALSENATDLLSDPINWDWDYDRVKLVFLQF